MTSYYSPATPFVTNQQQELIRQYFSHTPSQKEQVCSLCGWRLKLTGFDPIQTLSTHFMREHSLQWENIRMGTDNTVNQSMMYGTQDYEVPYGNGYHIEGMGSNLEDSRHYDNYYESHNNFEGYQNYQPAYKEDKHDNTNSQAWQSEYGYQWSNPVPNSQQSNYHQMYDAINQKSGLEEESNRNFSQYESNYSRQTLGNVYGNYDNFEGYDDFGYYGNDSNINNNPNDTRYGQHNEESVDDYSHTDQTSQLRLQSKNKSISKDKTMEFSKLKNAESNSLDQVASINKASGALLRNKLLANDTMSEISTVNREMGRQSQFDLKEKAKLKPAKSQSAVILQSDKNITYPSLIGIKNRPANFVAKINSQLYFEKPQFLSHIPADSLAYQLFSSKPSKQSPTIKQFFKAIDLALNRDSVIAMAKNKLYVSEEDATKLVDQYWWGGKEFQEIGMILSKRGIIFRESKEKNTVVITQRNILEDYIRYGECVYVVSFNQLVKLNRAEDGSELPYNVYLFMMADCRSESMFISVCLTKTNNSQNLLEMLEMFYASLHGFISNSIVMSYALGNLQTNKQAEKQLREAIKLFQEKYLSPGSLGLSVNYNNYLSNLAEQIGEIKEKERVNDNFNSQIQQELNELEKQLINLINHSPQSDWPEIEKFLQQVRIRIMMRKPLSPCLHSQDPKNIGEKANIFIGIINKRKEMESLYRKMHFLAKPAETKSVSFVELIGNVWRLSRYLKKIGKEVDLDYRFDYQAFKHPCMYKLWKKLGTKIFNVLEQNYLAALNLKLTHTSPVCIQVQQPCLPRTNFTKAATYTLTYLLGSDHWACNCGKLQETGIPCRHLIAVVLFYGGQIEHYLNDRWLLSKPDKQKLKKFRQKQPGDQE